ncbi:DUF2516 family protein [Actinomadura sp. HBU206391]|nr:DUF2516 family protein [Actinomadura sp. HBU206391]
MLQYFFWLLLIIAFVVEAWALFDAVRQPTTAYASAGKLTKRWWLIILGVATVVGLANAAAPLNGISPINLLLNILPVVAFIAAAVYHADVRPAVREYRGGQGGGSGPYGPW